MYGVARKRADLLKMSLVTSAAMLAICFLALAETTNTAEATSPPHNGKIVFARQTADAGGIYTVDPDGSSLSRLAKDATEPAWSPDGTKIAYNSFARIWVMDADGSNKRKLPMHSTGTGFMSPTWSANGTQLAFSTSTPVQSIVPDIYTSDADGSDLTNLTKSPEKWESAPSFSPNGSQMCFSGGNYKIGFGIFIANSDASNPTLLVGDEPPNRLYSSCNWSPDRTKIAYTYIPRGAGYPDVYVMNADGSGEINLTKSPKVDEDSPSWSPDGTKIVFSSDREDDSDIYTMDSDGSNVTQVTTDPDGFDLYADWQPLLGTTVDQPGTGGLSLLWVASALLSGSVLLYAMVKPEM